MADEKEEELCGAELVRVDCYESRCPKCGQVWDTKHDYDGTFTHCTRPAIDRSEIGGTASRGRVRE